MRVGGRRAALTIPARPPRHAPTGPRARRRRSARTRRSCSWSICCVSANRPADRDLAAPARLDSRPPHDARHPAHPRERLGGPRLRLRLRLRAGQHLHDRRRLRDRQRRALALLRARRSWSFRGNGSTVEQPQQRLLLPADHRRPHDREAAVGAAPPGGPRQEIRDGVRGYVAGYNRYLADTGVDNLPDPTCRGKPWVRPITEIDAYRRFYQLALLASQGVAIDGIGGGPAGRRRPRPSADDPRADRDRRWQAAARRHRLQRRRARHGGDRQRQGHAARQPALPVGRLRALLPGAAHDPRQARRHRREPVRRAAGPDRPHAQPGLEPHGLDRVPLHAVRADARARARRRPTSTTASPAR